MSRYVDIPAAADDAPTGGLDLVHARLVLIHVTQRAVALERMAGALRPGGWLLIEDFDPAMQPSACVDVVGPKQRLTYLDWFNHRRLHGEITDGASYTTPAEFEADHYRQTVAADQAATQWHEPLQNPGRFTASWALVRCPVQSVMLDDDS